MGRRSDVRVGGAGGRASGGTAGGRLSRRVNLNEWTGDGRATLAVGGRSSPEAIRIGSLCRCCDDVDDDDDDGDDDDIKLTFASLMSCPGVICGTVRCTMDELRRYYGIGTT